MVIGAVMARRAWKRYGWSEARLLLRSFVGMLLISVLGMVVPPILGLFAGEGDYVFEWFRVSGALFAIAAGVATISVSVGLYRLARRGALQSG